MSPEHPLQENRRSFMKLLAAAPLFASLQPGEELIVGNRLHQILGQARKQSA